ncbi:MAG: flavin reductase family protein [Pseudomonadota bacterium]
MHDARQDTRPDAAPSQAEFRKLMSRFATGVCVVSAKRADGAIAAMTINSFVSVSLEPLLVCWSLHNSASQYDLFSQAPRFGISILAADQGELALRYAARGDAGKSAEDFTRTAHGQPVIAGAIGHFDCRLWAAHPAGDHTMLLGEVVDLAPRDLIDTSVPALGFVNGQFCSIGE